MFKDRFTIEKSTQTKNGLLGKTYQRTIFNVMYKGCAINAFNSDEAAQSCIDDVTTLRADAEGAFDESLRGMGFDIKG